MLNHLKHKFLIISFPIEKQWKVSWRNQDKQIDGEQTSAISFNSIVCVYVAFKSVKVMHLNWYFHIGPTRKKTRRRNAPVGLISTKIRFKYA